MHDQGCLFFLSAFVLMVAQLGFFPIAPRRRNDVHAKKGEYRGRRISIRNGPS